MHDGMTYGPIQGQGQGHVTLKVGWPTGTASGLWKEENQRNTEKLWKNPPIK